MAKEMKNISELNNEIGIWNIPGDSNEVQGILHLKDGKIHMHTTELFEKDSFLYDGSTSYAIIDGFTATGKNITLFGNMFPSMSLNMPGMQQLIYTPSYIFIGQQFEDEKFKLKKISASFDGLSRWIGQQSISTKRDNINGEISVSYKNPFFEKIYCGNKAIYFEADGFLTGDIYSEVKIVQKMWVSIEFDEALEWTEAYSYIFDYAEFLTLCFGVKCTPKHINALDENGNEIQIFENNIYTNENKLKPVFLISYENIKDEYETVLNSWFKKQDEISPVISYFVEAHSKERVVKVIPQFLRMAQALESFSRKLRQSTLLPEEEHKAHVDKIVSQIQDEEDKEWVYNILSVPVINEPSCQQRIKRLFDELPKELNLDKRKLKSLSYKIVTTRNYYTHYNEQLKNNILEIEKMLFSITFMKYVLRILLVKELGINITSVVDNIKTDNEFNFAVDKLDVRKNISDK